MQGKQPTKNPAIQSPVPHDPCHAEVPRGVRIPHACAFASRRRTRSVRATGFTLTELLVVIAIIGVLASLIAAAAVNALRNAKRARIVLEIKTMAGAIENFKNEHGAYPPNAMNPIPAQNNPPSGSPTALAQNAVVAMFKKAFPRSQEPPGLILALCGQNTASGGPNLPNGMSAAEALYFWLGGFSSDAQYPISGPGGPSYVDTGTEGDEIHENRKGGFEFAIGRLGPKTDGVLDPTVVRFVEYPDPNNNTITRRINFWQFYPDGSERAYVYFDCSRHKPYQYDMRAFDTAVNPDAPDVYPILKLRSGVKATNGLATNLIFAEKFQILHAGLDDAWGEGFEVMGIYPQVSDVEADGLVIFPEGPFTGELADTLSNITDGELADSQE